MKTTTKRKTCSQKGCTTRFTGTTKRCPEHRGQGQRPVSAEDKRVKQAKASKAWKDISEQITRYEKSVGHKTTDLFSTLDDMKSFIELRKTNNSQVKPIMIDHPTELKTKGKNAGKPKAVLKALRLSPFDVCHIKPLNKGGTLDADNIMLWPLSENRAMGGDYWTGETTESSTSIDPFSDFRTKFGEGFIELLADTGRYTPKAKSEVEIPTWVDQVQATVDAGLIPEKRWAKKMIRRFTQFETIGSKEERAAFRVLTQYKHLAHKEKLIFDEGYSIFMGDTSTRLFNVGFRCHGELEYA